MIGIAQYVTPLDGLRKDGSDLRKSEAETFVEDSA